VLAACGGAPARSRAPIEHVSESARELVLYRDGALVRERRDVELSGGRATFSLPLPDDVEGGGIVARVVDGGDDVHVGALTVVAP